jgi:uncharacterized protein YjgD (DUF1641 family)
MAELTAPTASQPASLERKLDLLAAQVAFLTEQAEATARRQQERAELMHDILPIANDAIDLVTQQLDEVQEYVDLSDILRLTKRVLRNARNIDRMLDQLESLMDLAQTAGPLAGNVVEKVTDQLQAAEQRGYFQLARGSLRAVDKVAASLTPEDIDRMGDNLVAVAGAFKRLDEPVDPSLRSLVRQMRDPDVRRGLAMVMRVLRAIGAERAAEQQAAASAANTLAGSTVPATL